MKIYNFLGITLLVFLNISLAQEPCHIFLKKELNIETALFCKMGLIYPNHKIFQNGSNPSFDCQIYEKDNLEYAFCRGYQLFLDSKVRSGDFSSVLTEDIYTKSVFDALTALTFDNDVDEGEGEFNFKYCQKREIVHSQIHFQANLYLEHAFWTGYLSQFFLDRPLPEKDYSLMKFSEIAKEKGFHYLAHGGMLFKQKIFLIDGDETYIKTKNDIDGEELPFHFYMTLLKDIPHGDPNNLYGPTFLVPVEVLDSSPFFQLSDGWPNGGVYLGKTVTSLQSKNDFARLLDRINGTDAYSNEVVFGEEFIMSHFPTHLIGGEDNLNDGERIYWDRPNGPTVKQFLDDLRKKYPELKIIKLKSPNNEVFQDSI